MNICITGCCGFIGFHLSEFLIKKKINIFGLDTINNYYDVNLKKSRLKILNRYNNFLFKKIDISNYKKLDNFLKDKKIDVLINLAAYAGVQYSLNNPYKYFYANELGFLNICEISKKRKIKKIIFASSSSVIGDNKKIPFVENDRTDKPISLYGATKKNNEILAYYYSKFFNINFIGLRFFTVYGPYGRPDLSIFKFCDRILRKKKIILNNFGNHYRDFTYIDDVIYSIWKIIKLKKINKEPKLNKNFNIFNIGGGKNVKITRLVKLIEKYTNTKAKIKLGPFLKGDIHSSKASTTKIKKYINYAPKTRIEDGLKKFIFWFRDYYKI